MATALHTFMDIFNMDFQVDGKTVQLKKIAIPIIQRDYAQGRTDSDTERIRNRFLESLYRALTETPVTLDFVYGDIDAEGIMTPLDGQQRLTTLFLLHWYAAKKEKTDIKEHGFLGSFTYKTRYSARDFCSCMISFEPAFEQKISEEIIDQAWFPLDWKKDSTIGAMLVMLDAIDGKFRDVPGIWEKLKNKAITFYFLPIRDMGLTDELYIKMNSRGKPLTRFEHFKAEFEHTLHRVNEGTAKRIIRKIDLGWTDILWQYRSRDNVIDDEFLRYFRFICDIISYKNEGSRQGKRWNEFDVLKEYFSAENENAERNIEILEQYFDCWCEVKKDCSLKEFQEGFISLEHEPGKIKLDNKTDIFEDCLKNYADIHGNGNRTFPLNRMILLYSIVTYLLHRRDITEEQFRRRLRIIHNLVRNSEDEISDSEQRAAGNRMPAILRQTDSVMINGTINAEEENNFNSYQLEEEIEKIRWIEENPEFAEALYETEDHPLLRGQIAILGLECPENFTKFRALFACDWDAVDCALMAEGDYKQCERNGWRYQLGSKKMEKAWISLFHKSANQGFERTKAVLGKLLEETDDFHDEMLAEIKNSYIAQCEADSIFEWRYYYVRYDAFRPGRYGKYSWKDMKEGFYNMHVLWTESQWSENSYHPFLYEADADLISRADLGEYSILGNNYIVCENDAIFIIDVENDREAGRIKIRRDEDGIDREDRIVKLKKYLKRHAKEKRV